MRVPAQMRFANGERLVTETENLIEIKFPVGGSAADIGGQRCASRRAGTLPESSNVRESDA